MRALGFKPALVGIILAATVTPTTYVFADPSGASGVSGAADGSTITSIPLECKDDGPVVLGHIHCADLIKQVETLNRKHISYFTWNYYHGKFIDQGTGVMSPTPKPVCNISAGEQDTNQFGESCGPMCEFNVTLAPPSANPKGYPPQYCVREQAWASGALIQAINYYKEKVYKSFESKTLQLADFDGARPCGAQAADLLNLMHHRDGSEKALVDQRNAYGNSSEMKCDPKDLGGAGADQASCQLQMANTQIVTLWDLLLACEVVNSAVKDAYAHAQDRDALMSDAKSEGMSCAIEAGLCLICTDGMRSGIVNNCYKGKIPGYIKSKFDKYWSTSESLEKPIQPPSGNSSGNPTSSGPVKTDPWHSVPGADPAASLVAMASLGSFFKKRKRAFAAIGTFAGIILVLSAVNFVQPAIGNSDTCGCNGNCNGSGGQCNSCDQGSCAGCDACVACADCPSIISQKLPCLQGSAGASGVVPATPSGGSASGNNFSTSDDPSNWGGSSTNKSCSQIFQAEQKCMPSNSDDQKSLNACVSKYCGSGSSGNSGTGAGPSGLGTPPSSASTSLAPPAAPVAAATQKNLDGVDQATGNKGGQNNGGGAATAGSLPTGGTPPTADGGGGPGGGGTPPTAQGPANVAGAGGSDSGNGNNLPGVTLGGSDGSGAQGNDAGSGGDAATGSQTAFEANGGGGGGRGGAKSESGGLLGGLFGAGAGGPAGGAPTNVDFNKDGAGGNGSKDDEDTLKNSQGKSLFEIVNKRMDRWGTQSK